MSVFFRVDGFFFFIVVNAENAVLHKYIVQNSRSMLGAISEIVGNSVLILNPNLLNDFFNEIQELTIKTTVFKIKHFNTKMY